MASKRGKTQTGGRDASTGFIAGDYSLAVGMPSAPAPEGWNWTKLTDLARLESGHTPSRKFPEYWDEGVCWVGIRDATANHGQTIHDTIQHASPHGIENSSARMLPRNTVCLSRTASVGYVIVMGKEMATSQDFVNWVCGEQLDYQFLKYILLSENRSFLRFASGTTHQTIYFPEVKAFHICHPSISDQRAIAHILGTLDDKIELNRRMNETLEGMAQSLFKSWFVDFDPVIDNALAAGNPIPAELADRAEVRRAALADGTANREAAKPFPAAFQQTEELGCIPEGWEAKTLNDLGEVNRGRSRNRPRHAEHLYGGPYPFVQTGDIKAAGGRVTSYTQTYSEAGLAQSRLWPTDTMCITIAANIAETAVLTFPACFPDSVIGFIADEEKCKVYVAEYMFRILKERLQREATGSVQDNINLGTISRTFFVIPPIELQDEFYKVFGPVNDRIIRNERESLKLGALRDTLLPKLISGELRIPEAEQLTTEALA